MAPSRIGARYGGAGFAMDSEGGLLVSSGFAAGGDMFSCLWMGGVVFATVCDLFDVSLVVAIIPITITTVKTASTPAQQPFGDFLFTGGGIAGRDGVEAIWAAVPVDWI